jgi:chromosome segregation ATPase
MKDAKLLINFVVVASFIMLLFAGHPSAGELQEDYRKLEAKRQKLEDKRREYENKVKELSARLDDVSAELNNCIYEARRNTLKTQSQKVYEKWRVMWESRLKEAEVARETSEKERRMLLNLWKELSEPREAFENTRAEIEKRHTNKEPGSAYETEFREYMAELEKTYFSRIEGELFTGYDDYLVGAEGYLKFLKNSLELCKESQ